MEKQLIPTPFMRTVCDCNSCKECCRTMPGMLAPNDIPDIAEHLGISEKQLIEEHIVLGRGAKVARIFDSGKVEIIHIPTLTPRRKANGECHWLTEDGRCSIHAVSPYGCRFFDTHMRKEEGDVRLKFALMVLLPTSEPYQHIIREKQAANQATTQ